MAPISVNLTQGNPQTATVALIGEHDAYSADRVENELAVLLASRVPTVVDLSDTTFVDSQTLSRLLAARHQAETAGIGFTLVLPATQYTQVHRILEMTGLQSAFAIFPTLEHAEAAASDGRNGGDRARAA